MNKQLMTLALAGAAATAVLAQGQPIRIVGSLDLSGGAADVGRDALAGTQYAIEQLNKKGGVLGRPLTFEHQDGGSNPQRSISQANALLQGNAALLISPQSSGGTIAVSKAVTAKQKVPTCVAQSVADEITMKDFNPYIFSVTPTSFMEGRAMAARFAKLPYKRYALLSADYAGGRAGVNRFREFLKEMNPQAEIVVEEYPKFGATDYTASINKILAAKPDYVFSILFGNDLLTFSKQANSVGFFKQMDNKFMALYDFNTLKAMGDNAPVGTEGWQRAPANYLVKQSAQAKEFIDGYKAKNGGYPSDWTIMAYDCVMTWAQAAGAAKSVEPAAVMKAIETGQFDSARGSYRFAAYDHQASVPTYFGKVEQSKEFGQAVLSIQDFIAGDAARPTEAMVLATRGGK
ncbi:ABC transporter substrate-binding protein [Pseudorhodoferax sp.]|uniref:ABC transporter substrate-binding protein n=1 Tax=Pseudorhodoferax sp. TaxID=1993553 RepID=UPI0039E64E5D